MVTSYADVQAASKKWSDSETRTGTALQLVLDAICANGGGMEIFDKTPKGEEKNPICAAVEGGIMASYGVKAVKLADTPTKELSDKDKATKRYNRQQVASRSSKVKIALDKRLNPDKYAKTKERTDDNVKIPNMIAELRKRIETSEDFNGDLVALSDWMDACPVSPPSE
jgi:hypothetical protein